MFRRKASKLPEELIFPKTLNELGYLVNDQDQIRQIKNPEQKYSFKSNASARVSEMYREAMNSCVRDMAKERLIGLGFGVLRLPIGAGPLDKHVPIYLSPNIKQKKRVIVCFPDSHIDPTVLSFRISGEEAVGNGTISKMASGVMNGPTATSDNGAPGLLIANPGQLLWCRGESRAVTRFEWMNLPRPSAAHPCYRIDTEKNLIPGNTTSKEHVEYIFSNVLTEKYIDPECKIDIIGLEWTGKEVVDYLALNWSQWSGRISSICFSCPQHRIPHLYELDAPDDFIDFLSKKCRAYFVSTKARGTIVEGRLEYGCNCYASGDEMYADQVLIRAWPAMLDHFNAVHTLEDYEEVERYAPGELEGNQSSEGEGWAN